jgi:hypothetical protein
VLEGATVIGNQSVVSDQELSGTPNLGDSEHFPYFIAALLPYFKDY